MRFNNLPLIFLILLIFLTASLNRHHPKMFDHDLIILNIEIILKMYYFPLITIAITNLRLFPFIIILESTNFLCLI